MVEYSHADIHLGVGCRYKDCPNLLLCHLSFRKERSSPWVTPMLRYGKVMKSLSVQDMVKMSKSTQATAPLSLLPIAPVTTNHPHHVSPAASASMTNTKLQPVLSLFPQPETQMCVQN